MRQPSWHRHLALGLVCALITGALVLTSPRASADPETPSTVDAAIADAKVLGEGLVTAYRKGDATLLLLPANAYERLFVWSAETVSVPTGVVDFLPLGSVIIQLERHEKSIYVLDLSATFGKRASGQQDPEPGQEEGHRIDPMSIAVRRANEPPVAAVLPIVAQEEDGRVLVFGAGTGNPFFTTDTAAALRGAEIGAQIVLKATKVDGVYSADPKLDPAAERFTRISFDEVISRDLRVMDATAFALCRDQKLPINVFSIFKPGALRRVVMGEDEGTLVYC